MSTRLTVVDLWGIRKKLCFLQSHKLYKGWRRKSFKRGHNKLAIHAPPADQIFSTVTGESSVLPPLWIHRMTKVYSTQKLLLLMMIMMPTRWWREETSRKFSSISHFHRCRLPRPEEINWTWRDVRWSSCAGLCDRGRTLPCWAYGRVWASVRGYLLNFSGKAIYVFPLSTTTKKKKTESPLPLPHWWRLRNSWHKTRRKFLEMEHEQENILPWKISCEGEL